MYRTMRITTGLRRTAQAVLLGAALLVALILALGVTSALAAVPGDPLRLG
jgi:hypothetical protein